MDRSEVRTVIREEWCRLLQIEDADGRQDFFELGGDSLTAIELVTAVHDRIGVDVPLDAFFEDGSLAGIEQRACAEHPGEWQV